MATTTDRNGRRTRSRGWGGCQPANQNAFDWRGTTLADIREIMLASFPEDTGILAVIEAEADVPFPIERVFTISGMSKGAVRGRHTLLSCNQVLICLGGVCDVLCDDGSQRRTVRLDSPHQALHLPPGIWRELSAAADGTVVMVLCDQPYDPDDYINEMDEFRRRKTD